MPPPPPPSSDPRSPKATQGHVLSPQAAPGPVSQPQQAQACRQLSPLWSLWRAGGPRGRDWGRDSSGGRVSLKRSREGDPTWAAVGPDGARSPALIKGQVSPGSVAIVGGRASGWGHLQRLSVGKRRRPSPGRGPVACRSGGGARQGEKRLGPRSPATCHLGSPPR